VYPLLDRATGRLTTADSVELPHDLRSLHRHLVERGRIKPLCNYDERVLHIFSREVLRLIKVHDSSWEEMVPPEIAGVIKRRRFFGCSPELT
jgi:hypothetical protein